MPRKYLLLIVLLALSFLIPIFIQPIKTIAFGQNPINPKTLTEEYDSTKRFGTFENKLVEIPTYNPLLSNPKVLGDTTTTSNKRIEVNLTQQRLYAYENDSLLFSFLISSGKWNSTPNGTFKIWAKVRSQKMSGGSKTLGTYYYLPNVPYIMFFYNETTKKQLGYSIHGTYWHNNFGQPMSHGCINMITADAKKLYEWATMDTPVMIYGKFSPVSSKSSPPKG